MGKAVERRALRFASLDDALGDMDKLVAAESAGKLRHTGSWELGQTLGHVATWAEIPFKGYPPEVRAPLPVRVILKLMKGTILNKGMTTGVKIGKVPGGTLGIEKIPTRDGADRLRAAFNRLKSDCPNVVNPVFGVLTHDEWIKLNLRHAELHFSFQHPQN